MQKLDHPLADEFANAVLEVTVAGKLLWKPTYKGYFSADLGGFTLLLAPQDHPRSQVTGKHRLAVYTKDGAELGVVVVDTTLWNYAAAGAPSGLALALAALKAL